MDVDDLDQSIQDISTTKSNQKGRKVTREETVEELIAKLE